MTPVKYATQIAMHPDDSGRVERGLGLGTDWIYPGHGKPFRLNQVTENR
jgi:hypothetical protein